MLGYVLYANSPKTRRERANDLRQDGLKQIKGELSELLLDILQSYEIHGDSELEIPKLASFLIGRYGSVSEGKSHISENCRRSRQPSDRCRRNFTPIDYKKFCQGTPADQCQRPARVGHHERLTSSGRCPVDPNRPGERPHHFQRVDKIYRSQPSSWMRSTKGRKVLGSLEIKYSSLEANIFLDLLAELFYSDPTW